MKHSPKLGVSLIAVLMFMLAATTASLVVFRSLGSENFSSGSRLKSSEAWQASESGIDAVRSWMANRASDVAALVTAYENNRRPIRLDLGGIGGSKEQEFSAYLMGVDTRSPIKLRFLVEGKARDDSRISQTAIFSTDGLYKVRVMDNGDANDCDFNLAYYGGGIGGNTQTRFSSAVINGNFTSNGVEVTGTLLVTGNMDVNTPAIGCGNASESIVTTSNNGNTIGGIKAEECAKLDLATIESGGNLYVAGNVRMSNAYCICGNTYIGENFESNSTGRFKRDLYAEGDVSFTGGDGFYVDNNMTSGGIIDINSRHLRVNENLAITNTNGGVKIENGSNLTVEGNFWSLARLKGSNANYKDSNDYGKVYYDGYYDRIKLANTSGEVYLPTEWIDDYSGNGDGVGGTKYRQDSVHFISRVGNIPKEAKIANRPTLASTLQDLADKIDSETGMVPDPIEVPDDEKAKWIAKGKKLAQLFKSGDTLSLPKACLRLVGTPKEPKSDYDSHWGFGDLLPEGSTISDYPLMGVGVGGCTGDKSLQYNFIKAANDCYRSLKSNDPKGILYPDDYASEKFLPLVVNNPEEKTPCGYFDGNFIFAYENDMGKTMKLPPTTDDSKVFLYFQQGATANMPLEETCQSLPSPCKRNYFIFSEKDIAGTTGSTSINGTIFLAKGAKVTGKLPDAGISFNKDLFDALVNAGILEQTSVDADGNLITCGSGGTSFPDEYYIPVSSRLSVKLESKEISKEKNPADSELNNDFGPSILVMPRIVRITTNQLNASNPLSKYYAYMYQNGATEANGSENLPSCEGKTTFRNNGSNSAGLYTCTFGNTRVPHSNFYVVVAGSNGNPKMWLEADRTTVEDSPGPECANVSLRAEENEENTDRKATLKVRPEAHLGWNIYEYNTTADISLEKAFTIPSGQLSVGAYTICVTGETTGSDVTVNIESVDEGMIWGNPSSLTIKKDSKGFVNREELTGLYNGVDLNERLNCQSPNENSWTVTTNNGSCSKESVPKDGAKETWKCQEGATATLAPSTSSDACEIFVSPLTTPVNNGDQSLKGTITGPNGPHLTFKTAYKRKIHELTVVNNTSCGISIEPAAPNNEGAPDYTFNSTSGKYELYHGLNYGIVLEAGCHYKKITLKEGNNSAKTIKENPYASITQNATLTIFAPGGCDYDPDEDWCNGKELKETAPNECNACFFVTGITKFCSNGSNSKINGEFVGQGNIGCWSNNRTPPDKKDGGYYILVDGCIENGNWEGTTGSPNCWEEENGTGGGSSNSNSGVSSSSGGSSSSSEGILTDNGELLITKGTTVVINEGTTHAQCSDDTEQIICRPNSQCTSGWTFTINGEEKTIQDFQCNSNSYQAYDMSCGSVYKIEIPAGKSLQCEKNW